MIIDRLDLIAFGRFTGVQLDLSAGPNRFHLVYGPNESGKSTSLRAIQSWLFGMPHSTSDDYVHPMAKIRVGGKLAEHDGTTLECIRRRGRKGTLRDASDDETIDEALLERMLGGIDKTTFETRFGLSHSELLRGGQQILRGEGEVGEILFAAGAGIGRLQEIASQLGDEVGGLFKTRGKSSIAEMLKDIESKRRELRELQVPPAEFEQLQNRYSEIQTKIDAFKTDSSKQVSRLSRLRASLQALPLVPRWQSASKTFSNLASAPLLSQDFAERRRLWEQDHKLALARREHLLRQCELLTNELAQLVDDKVVREHEVEIEEVYRQLATREKADRDRISLHELAGKLQQRMLERLARFEMDEDISGELDITARVESVRLTDTARDSVKKLAQQYEKRVQQRDDAQELIDRLRGQLRRDEAETKVITSPDPEVLAKALDEVGMPQRLVDEVATASDSCEQAIKRCQDLNHKLGVACDFSDMVRLRLPDATSIAELQVRLESTHDSYRAANQQYAQMRQELSDAQDHLEQLQAEHALPTIGDLSEARRRRDLLIEQLVDEARLGVTIEPAKFLTPLKASVDAADAIADQLQAHHGAVHRIETGSANVQSLSRSLASHQSKLQQQLEQYQDTLNEWSQLWTPLGIEAAAPAKMALWMTDHRRLCELAALSQEAENVRSAALRRLHQSCERLRLALVDVGVDFVLDPSDPAAALVQYFNQALTRRNELVQHRKSMESNAKRREQTQRDLDEAILQLEKWQLALDRWHGEWKVATGALACDNTLATSSALDMLEWIKDLEHQLHEFHVLEKRVRSIAEEHAAYQHQVARLVENISESTDDSLLPKIADDLMDPIRLAVTHLYQRFQRERGTRTSRESFNKQLDASKQEQTANEQELNRLEVVAAQLCDEAGCECTDDLSLLERQSQFRREAQSELKDLDAQLTYLAGDQALDEFIHALGEVGADAIEVEIASIESEKHALDEELAKSQQDLGSLRHQIEAIDGGNRASQLSQSLQLDVGRLQRECQRYIRLKLAAAVLQQAIDHYRRENQGPVLAAAEQYFSTLTCGEYSGLRVDYDAKGVPVLQGVRGDLTVAAPAMSTGTADALYLSLRLASLKHQMSHGKAIPLIIDDCLIQLDDRRATAALRAFSELSTTTQVILFTHHEHLIELASETLPANGYHLHRLAT